MTDEDTTADSKDPLLTPFTNLNSRKIPIQDDKYRGWLLVIYCSFLLIGLPMWWYCTNVPSVTIPSNFLNDINAHLQQNQEFTVNLYGNDLKNEPSPMVINGFSFKFNLKSEIASISSSDNNTPFMINLIVSKNNNLKSSKRTVVIKDSNEIEKVLTELTNIKFEAPKLNKSKIKLKFTYLTEIFEDFKWDFMDNFDNFLSNLTPVVSFESNYYTKYLDTEILFKDSEISREMFIGSDPIVNFDSRDDRGRGNIFNFVLIKGSEEKAHYISNWGIILQFTKETRIDSVLLGGLKKLLGFPNEFSDYELIEIDLWISNLKKFYLQESEKMVSQLINEPSSVVIRPEIYKKKLLVAWKQLKDPKTMFDLIESAYHDPKLIGTAYFPNEHKFAVYLPVYLPLILPILVALLTFIKEQKKPKDSKDATENNNKLKTQ